MIESWQSPSDETGKHARLKIACRKACGFNSHLGHYAYLFRFIMIRDTLKKIVLPLIFLGAAVSLFFVWKIFDLPPQERLIEIARSYFDAYGLITIFISSILEGVLLVGWYYPGSLVIFLGVIFAGHNIVRVVEVISFVTAGFFVAYALNFALGKYGWYRVLLVLGLREPLERAKHRLANYGLRAIFLTYWHPNLAGLTSTAAGILHIPFKKFFFYSCISAILWNIFWGSLVYFLGEQALTLIGFRFVLIILGIWILVRIFSEKLNTKISSI